MLTSTIALSALTLTTFAMDVSPLSRPLTSTASSSGSELSNDTVDIGDVSHFMDEDVFLTPSAQFRTVRERSAYEYDSSHFTLEEDFPDILMSFATANRDGHGQDDMWAIANLVRKQGFSTYNCLQAEAASNWKVKWFGKRRETKLALILLDKPFFKSEGCVEELLAILTRRMAFIPINFGVDIDFMHGNITEHVYAGDDTKIRETSNLIQEFLGNIFPVYQKGLMLEPANWHRNAKELVDEVKLKMRHMESVRSKKKDIAHQRASV